MLKAGSATRTITHDLGRPVQGATTGNLADAVRDDLEANACYLSNEDDAILLISCDLGAVENPYLPSLRRAVADAAGMEERGVLISVTHTHNGPVMIPSNPRKPVDEDYVERLHSWLPELARIAVGTARPASIAWGAGRARIAYNRRCCWADGSHTMHGDTRRKGFTGLEGPDDPGQVSLFVADENEEMIAVIQHATSHPTCFYGHNIYTADFPGESRAYLREVLGEVPVLFLNGAFGDQANQNQLTKHYRKETSEQRVKRLAHIVTGETLRLLHENRFHDDVPLAHTFEDMQVDVRLPVAERLDWAEKTIAKVEAGEEVSRWDRTLSAAVKLLVDQFGENPREHVPVHALRIGDVGLVTVPCELFSQFGLDIKRRSPAPVTGVVGMTDGYVGYVPTTSGLIGGGYSGEPIYWTRCEAQTGYRIVETASRLLRQLWPGRGV